MSSRMLPYLVLAAIAAPESAWSEVDEDCLSAEDSFMCMRSRLEDAKTVNALLLPILERFGWRDHCFTVQYVAGDEGSRDSIVVTLHGAARTDESECRKMLLSRLGQDEVNGLTRTKAPLNAWVGAIGRKSVAAQKKSMPTSKQLKPMATSIRRALREAQKPIRERVLARTKALNLGTQFDTRADLSLP